MLIFDRASKVIRKHPHLLLCFLTIVAIGLSVAFFSNMSVMSIAWTFPYFSGAANFDTLFHWQISSSDYAFVQQLNDLDYRHYIHKTSEDTVDYSLNSYGYVLIALISRILFGSFGDIQGVVVLQVIVHILMCIFLCTCVIDGLRSRLLFVLLYAANPLVIHFVTFPFYYFWLSLPSVCLATLILRPDWASRVVLFSTPLLLLSLLIRPTTIFLCIFFYVIAWMYIPVRRRFLAAIAFLWFIAGVVVFSHFNPRIPPYHTMYVGLGAYGNDVGVHSLSDGEGFRYFMSETNVDISTSPIDGNWGAPELMSSYNEIILGRYLRIVSSRPIMVIRNAFLSLGQVFSVGYIVESPFLSLLSSVSGFFVLVFLLLRKQFVWAIAIFSSALAFFWYFPPIPAYNFAAILLLVCGLLSAFNPTSKA